MMCYKEALQADEERASYLGKVGFWSLYSRRRFVGSLYSPKLLSHCLLVLRVDQFCERCPAVWTIASIIETGRYQSRLDINADSYVYRHGVGIPGRR
jgi:hypothetical protein